MKLINRTRICVPVCVSHVSELAAAVGRAARIGDFVELRLDCLTGDELTRLQRDLPTLLKSLSHPLILTLRPVEQGGRREIDNLTRVIFWTQFFSQEQPTDVWADIELDLALFFQEREKDGSAILDWQRVICSHHDFTGTGSEAVKIYEQMSATPARVLKIAVQANDANDCLPLFRLLDRARDEGRELIAIAMGHAGLATRILGPARGSYLTYGSLDKEHQTAPGQISAARLRSLYRVEQLDRQAMITGLVGSPISHSVSPQMHNAAFKASDSNAVYIPFEVQHLDAFIRRMVHPRTRELDWNLRGVGVTAPHKSAIMEHLDFVEPSAAEIGAVNTVVINEGELRGYNTDVTAFVKTLSEQMGVLRGLRCAIIGAGGAARAVLWGLQQQGAQPTIFARAADNAKALAEKFASSFAPLAEASFNVFDIVINSTPLGTRGPLESETPAVAAQLRGARLAYDLVYNPTETRFIREAREAGCETMGGLSMLVAQAAEQFQLWTGAEAPVGLMRKAAQASLDMSHAEADDE
ncbi:MAG TPA: shikimate dehydrogenase [Pyrinomonadaceae bacterium]|jgi:3-dehydroquinate dehydratase/shikimate dehydrogenase